MVCKNLRVVKTEVLYCTFLNGALSQKATWHWKCIANLTHANHGSYVLDINILLVAFHAVPSTCFTHFENEQLIVNCFMILASTLINCMSHSPQRICHKNIPDTSAGHSWWVCEDIATWPKKLQVFSWNRRPGIIKTIFKGWLPVWVQIAICKGQMWLHPLGLPPQKWHW